METKNKTTLPPVEADKSVAPTFDRTIFWDVDYDTLDIDGYADWVITRVFERGDVEDIRQCRRYYGDKHIRKALLNAKFIMEHRLHLASVIINEPVQAFRCYKLRQSNPEHYPY